MNALKDLSDQYSVVTIGGFDPDESIDPHSDFKLDELSQFSQEFFPKQPFADIFFQSNSLTGFEFPKEAVFGVEVDVLFRIFR